LIYMAVKAERVGGVGRSLSLAARLVYTLCVSTHIAVRFICSYYNFVFADKISIVGIQLYKGIW
jgi:hypothetical protein